MSELPPPHLFMFYQVLSFAVQIIFYITLLNRWPKQSVGSQVRVSTKPSLCFVLYGLCCLPHKILYILGHIPCVNWILQVFTCILILFYFLDIKFDCIIAVISHLAIHSLPTLSFPKASALKALIILYVGLCTFFPDCYFLMFHWFCIDIYSLNFMFKFHL